MPKRSAEDEDGPEQKLARTSQQDGQAQGSAAPLRKVSPQVPPPMPKSIQEFVDASTETIWSRTLDFQNRPLNNDQRHNVDIISGKIHSFEEVNTDNWPEQLKMTVISHADYWKFRSLDVTELTGVCEFLLEDVFDKKSPGAFIQYTQSGGFHRVCFLLEYTSSAIQVLFLKSFFLEDKMITLVLIMKYSNNDHNVKLLTDLGILSHATVYNVLTKENARQKEELQQKDKMLVKQQMFHREEVEMLKTKMKEEKARMKKDKDEMQRERGVMQNQILERERTIYQKDSTISEKDVAIKKKDEALQEKDEVISERESILVHKETELMEKENIIMTIEQEKDNLQRGNTEIQTRCFVLENEVRTIKMAILDDIEKEFLCTICQHTLTKAQTLNCGHSFCTQCIKDERMLTNDGNARPCPNCVQPWTTNVPSIVIDSCVEKIDKLKNEATRETETEGEPMSVGSDDESTSASSPSSSGSSSSSLCRNPSSIKNMLSPASSSDSDWTEET